MLIFASMPTAASAPIATPRRGVKPRRKARAKREEGPRRGRVQDGVAGHPAGREGEHRLKGDRKGADRPSPRSARQELSQEEEDEQDRHRGEQRGEEAHHVHPVGKGGRRREAVDGRGRRVVERRVVGVRGVAAFAEPISRGIDGALEPLVG